MQIKNIKYLSLKFSYMNTAVFFLIVVVGCHLISKTASRGVKIEDSYNILFV